MRKARVDLTVNKNLLKLAKTLKLNMSALFEESLIVEFEDKPTVTEIKIKRKEKELEKLKKLLEYQKEGF